MLWVQDEASGTAGEIELCNGRVVGARVSAAAAPWKPLGQLLVEMGELETAALRRGLSEQIVHNTATIMGWRRGVFRFRVHDGGGAGTRAAALEVAFEPHELVLEAARLADEAAAPAGVH